MSTPNGQIKIGTAFRKVPITADSSGKLPERIQLMKTGEWPAASNKGPLTETKSSLYEYKRNFEAGVGQSKDVTGNWMGIHIDYMHENWAKAAAWIHAMSVEDDPERPGEAILWGEQIEWTPAGGQAVLDGEFKLFSPSWWPAARGDWTDPEDPNITARNVIDGGGLTNIPFFKGLQSLVATRDNVEEIFVKADERKVMPTLDEVRIKDASALSEEEKAFVAEHKAELSPEEQTKFGVAEAAAPVVVEDPNKNNGEQIVTETPEITEALAVTASVKAGESVVVKASEFQSLQAQVKASTDKLAELNREKVEASVTKHLERGAIKADQVKPWTDLITADATKMSMLEALNDNAQMASEIGKDNGAGETSALAELRTKRDEAVKASRDDGTELSAGDAMSQVRRDNPELAKQADAEIRGN